LDALSQRVATKQQNAARPAALLFTARPWVYARFPLSAAKQTCRRTRRKCDDARQTRLSAIYPTP